MKTLLVLWLAVFGLCAQARAAACTPTTYDNYKADAFSCTVGPLTFSNFTSNFANSHDLGGMAIGDTNVDVTILMAGGEYGLQFSLGAGMAVRGDNTNAPMTGQAMFTFDVAGPPLALAKIALSGTRDGNGTNATYTANVSGTTLDTEAANRKFADSQPLPGMPMMVSVTDTAKSFVPGGTPQQAQIQSIQNTFTVAPEPGTLSGFALGAAAFLADPRGQEIDATGPGVRHKSDTSGGAGSPQ